jgi:hypothetical protein
LGTGGYHAFTSSACERIAISGLFLTFATKNTTQGRQGADPRGENVGFSTFFSTVVENFGGSPYGSAGRGDFNIAFER